MLPLMSLYKHSALGCSPGEVLLILQSCCSPIETAVLHAGLAPHTGLVLHQLCSATWLQTDRSQIQQNLGKLPLTRGGESSVLNDPVFLAGVSYVDFRCKFYFRAGFTVLGVSSLAF